ncbi:hypothetical protein [Candidatus Bathycorpusculum sp.]
MITAYRCASKRDVTLYGSVTPMNTVAHGICSSAKLFASSTTV